MSDTFDHELEAFERFENGEIDWAENNNEYEEDNDSESEEISD